ncbi:MAG: DUF1653 domain-containing protein [Lachnospiraceae bacterium]|nr:DUF1653 domain-containing protein [Lachnospiraceae bacterium]
MPQGNPKPGEFYLHFKDKLYQVLTVAKHSETGEDLVIYQALYGGFQTYARPLEMFISPVDKEKYPDVRQEYRFQLTERSTGESQEKEPQAEKRISAAASTAEEKMMAFFDAGTMEEKYQILVEMRGDVTDRMINNMAVALDVVIEEGPLDQRYEDLKTCVRTFQKYEVERSQR